MGWNGKKTRSVLGHVDVVPERDSDGIFTGRHVAALVPSWTHLMLATAWRQLSLKVQK